MEELLPETDATVDPTPSAQPSEDATQQTPKTDPPLCNGHEDDSTETEAESAAPPAIDGDENESEQSEPKNDSSDSTSAPQTVECDGRTDAADEEDGPEAPSAPHETVECDEKAESETAQPTAAIDCDEIETETKNDSCDSNKENNNEEAMFAGFDTYTEQEKCVYDTMFAAGEQPVQFVRNHCTVCNEHLSTAPSSYKGWKVHPCLKVVMCKSCYDFYGTGEFEKDEDGSEMYCRWCGQGGNVLCCSTCEHVFCQKCIRINFTKRALEQIKKSDDWYCYVCDPTLLIHMTVRFKALYQYAMKKIRKGAPDLDKDESLCCCKTKPVVRVAKKRRAGSPDLTYTPFLESALTNKKKLKTYSILEKDNPIADWGAAESDEVVCTPDVSMLMMNEEESPTPSESAVAAAASAVAAAARPNMLPPPLRPMAANLNGSAPGEYMLIPQGDGYQLTPSQIKFINPAAANFFLSSVPNLQMRPPMVIGSIAPAQQQSNGFAAATAPNSTTLLTSNKQQEEQRLIVGQKHEWFEKAEQLITTINRNLSVTLATLAHDQREATTIRDLASVHNNLQKILSSSTNALTQVRRNLKNNFLNGLKVARFEPRARIHDGEVIVVDAPARPQSVAVAKAKAKATYLKVKSVAQLNTSPNSIIDITDDAGEEEDGEKVVEERGRDEKKLETVGGSKGKSTGGRKRKQMETDEENGEAANNEEPAGGGKRMRMETDREEVAETNETNKEDEDEAMDDLSVMPLSPNTRFDIKNALLDSKFDLIFNENLKYRAKDVAADHLKRMLAVRVLLEKDFGAGTAKTLRSTTYTCMNVKSKGPEIEDFEAMLSSSIVSKPCTSRESDSESEVVMVDEGDKDVVHMDNEDEEENVSSEINPSGEEAMKVGDPSMQSTDPNRNDINS